MIDGTARDLEWFIIFVFRYQRNGFVVGALLYLFNKRALVGVEDVNLTPLEEQVGRWQHLARHHITRVITWLHGVATYIYKEVGIFESWHDIAVTFLQKNGLATRKAARHCFHWNERNARPIFCRC